MIHWLEGYLLILQPMTEGVLHMILNLLKNTVSLALLESQVLI